MKRLFIYPMKAALLALVLGLNPGMSKAARVSLPLPRAESALAAAEAAQISPSDAALIARKSHPNATVLSVKLLPDGAYAVTLKDGGNVLRVLVNAATGAEM